MGLPFLPTACRALAVKNYRQNNPPQVSLFTRRKCPTIPPQVSLFTRRKCPTLPAASVLLSYSTLVDNLQRCGNPTTAKLRGEALPLPPLAFGNSPLLQGLSGAPLSARRVICCTRPLRGMFGDKKTGLAAPRCSNPDRILQRIGRKKRAIRRRTDREGPIWPTEAR